MAHEDLKAIWREGQRWETLVEGCTTWVPVLGVPVWDPRQQYKLIEDIAAPPNDDAKRLDWLEAAYTEGALHKARWAEFMTQVAAVGYRAAIDASIAAGK